MPRRGLRNHFGTPLYRNGYMLMFSGTASSALGFLYWLVAARIYSSSVVGLNAGAVSAILLLAGVGQLSLNNVLVRFVPQAGQATHHLVLVAYGLGVLASVVVSISFIFGIYLGLWSPALQSLVDRPLSFALFVISTSVWCIFSLQDSVLTGLRRTEWVPVENILYAASKIALLILFARLFQSYGVLASWVIPAAATLIPVNYLVFGRFIRPHVCGTIENAAPVRWRPVARYAAGNYLGSLFFLASTTLLPILVLNEAGSSASAYFYLPWTIITSLQIVAANMAVSLTLEGVRDPATLGYNCQRTLVHLSRLLIPVMIFILIAAPVILQVFGSEYAENGTSLMRLLALSLAPNAIVALYFGMARARNEAAGIAGVQAVLCFLIIGLSVVLQRAFGTVGIGVAYLTSQLLVGALVYGLYMHPLLVTPTAVREHSK